MVSSNSRNYFLEKKTLITNTQTVSISHTAIANILNTEDEVLSKKLWLVANLICEIYLDFENTLIQNPVVYNIGFNWEFTDLSKEFNQYLSHSEEPYKRYMEACKDLFQIHDSYIPNLYFGFTNHENDNLRFSPIAKMVSFHFVKIAQFHAPCIHENSKSLSSLILGCTGLTQMAIELDVQDRVLAKIKSSMQKTHNYPFI
jgi:hypothetical protein